MSKIEFETTILISAMVDGKKEGTKFKIEISSDKVFKDKEEILNCKRDIEEIILDAIEDHNIHFYNINKDLLKEEIMIYSKLKNLIVLNIEEIKV